jgi:spore maturation protein CgeB
VNTIPTELCRSDMELHGMTTCAECGTMIMQDLAVVAVYYTDRVQENEHFCSQHCKETWYVRRLNTLGM